MLMETKPISSKLYEKDSRFWLSELPNKIKYCCRNRNASEPYFG